MTNIYYRGIFAIFIVFYSLLYIRAKKGDLKNIYINKYLSIFLGRSDGKNNTPLIILIGHLINVIILIVGILTYLLTDKRYALEIYKYSILIALFIFLIMDIFLNKKS